MLVKKAFYNEFDPFAAKWLGNLSKAGKITEGIVDGRDFRELKPEDVEGYEQCHFFAGIGGWSLALELAGWEGPVWTASLPCQPFSIAGKRNGAKDDRHLFPDFIKLVSKCKPPIIFGEQVASPDGRLWLSGLRTEMEALGYAVGAADLCAAGVQAPHIRQRLFWVAHSKGFQDSSWMQHVSGEQNIQLQGEPGGSRLEEKRNATDWVPEPKSNRVVDGFPSRVGLIHGFGNAIVPKVAAEFIMAFKEAVLCS